MTALISELRIIRMMRLKKHEYELLAEDRTYIRIDAAVSGVGSASCGPALPEEYGVHGGRLDFSFTMKPIVK